MPSAHPRRVTRAIALFCGFAATLATVTLISQPAEAASSKKPAAVSAGQTRYSANTTTVKIRWKKPARSTSVGICLKPSLSTKKCVRWKRTRGTTATFRHLSPTGGNDYYYRIRSFNSRGSSLSKWKPVNLWVKKAGRVTRTGGAGHFLAFSWNRVTNASTYHVQISTDPRFRTSVRTRDSSWKRSISLGSLNGGMTYYTRVRGVNGTKLGGWSKATTTVLGQTPVKVNVLTFNLCGENKCRPGTSPAFLKAVPPWTQRKAVAGRLARSGAPDVVVTQESVASKTAFHTELPGFTRGAYWRAKAIYYRTSRFTSLGSGGITLDAKNEKYATWNWLRDRAKGTTFIIVDAHLISGKGKALDDLRAAQTRTLINRVTALNTHKVPVVWGGDWNSNDSNANQSKYPGGYDAPLRKFAAVGAVNSLAVTGSATNADLNSANQGRVIPFANSDHVDAVYVPTSGVKVESWAMLASFSDTPDPVTGGRVYRTPFASDHNPVLARLLVGTP